MARKRMFDNEIINQDSFLDLPMEAKALYFLLGMEADDEGFVSPKKVLRMHGGTEDSLKILILKNYLIPFPSGVVVITDWKRNNYLDKNKIKETIYLEEKSQLIYNKDSEKYESLTKVKLELNQYRIEENSIEEKNYYNLDNINSNSSSRCFDFFQENFINATPYEYSVIESLVEDYGEELVLKALQKSLEAGKRNLNYAKGTLRNWKRDGTSIEDLKEDVKQEEKAQRRIF